jgi:hypothetical protein
MLEKVMQKFHKLSYEVILGTIFMNQIGRPKFKRIFMSLQSSKCQNGCKKCRGLVKRRMAIFYDHIFTNRLRKQNKGRLIKHT